jgi:hypothetical protein
MLPKYTTAIYQGEPSNETVCQWVSTSETGELLSENEADLSSYSQTITVIIDDFLE